MTPYADINRLDPAFLRWVHHHMGGCLFCTQKATDWCHVQHGSSRTSDYLGFPACNACHMALDHAPRHGERKLLKDAYVKECLAWWFAVDWQILMRRYREERLIPSTGEAGSASPAARSGR